jgi:hypothetical protein
MWVLRFDYLHRPFHALTKTLNLNPSDPLHQRQKFFVERLPVMKLGLN